MNNQDIEREVHLLILNQLLAKAEQKGLTQRVLAEAAGISEIQLSRIKRGHGKQQRPLSPDVARKLMQALNYKASQIRRIELALRHLKEKKHIRRRALKLKGIDLLHTECDACLEKKGSEVVVTVRCTKKGKKAVCVVIECKKKDVHYCALPTKEFVSLSDTLKYLLPHKKHRLIHFGFSVLLALQSEWLKKWAGDIENLDSDRSVRMMGVNQSLYGFSSVDEMVKEAQSIFEHALGL